jgi:hypothetical protein
MPQSSESRNTLKLPFSKSRRFRAATRQLPEKAPRKKILPIREPRNALNSVDEYAGLLCVFVRDRSQSTKSHFLTNIPLKSAFSRVKGGARPG